MKKLLAAMFVALLMVGCEDEAVSSGMEDGLHTEYHSNGQKKWEGTYRDGKMVGLSTVWHENGEKWREQTLKDGKKVSEKWWNRKGEEVETMEEASD